MKKVFLSMLTLLLLLTTLVGCSTTNENVKIEIKPEINEKSVTQHINLWSQTPLTKEDEVLNKNFSLHLTTGNAEHSIDFNTGDRYSAKKISNDVAVIKSNMTQKEVAIVVMMENFEKKLEPNKVEEFTDFTVDSELTWKCYKVLMDDESEIFIFERQGDDGLTGRYLIEVSGTNLETLQKVVSDLTTTGALSYVPDAIF